MVDGETSTRRWGRKRCAAAQASGVIHVVCTECTVTRTRLRSRDPNDRNADGYPHLGSLSQLTAKSGSRSQLVETVAFARSFNPRDVAWPGTRVGPGPARDLGNRVESLGYRHATWDFQTRDTTTTDSSLGVDPGTCSPARGYINRRNVNVRSNRRGRDTHTNDMLSIRSAPKNVSTLRPSFKCNTVHGKPNAP